jgi:hypothetical protein
MILLKLLIINLVAILIIDLSGFIDNFKLLISKLLTKNNFKTTEFSLKPFDCSYCLTFWCSIFYLIIIGQFTFVNLFFVILITHFTDVTKQLMILLKDVLIKLIDIIYDKLSIK